MPNGWANKIIINQKIQAGKPVVKGTRVPVYVVLGALAAGMGYKEVEKEYGIGSDDILSCLNYATEIVSSEEVYAFKK